MNQPTNEVVDVAKLVLDQPDAPSNATLEVMVSLLESHTPFIPWHIQERSALINEIKTARRTREQFQSRWK